jgi:hypothetical protein
MISKFGWKIVNFNNKKKCWEAMDEYEFREVIGTLLKIDPSKVDINLNDCHPVGGKCHGECSPHDPHDPGEFCTTIHIGDRLDCICIGILEEADRIKLSKL